MVEPPKIGLDTPFSIGTLTLVNRLVLAPMAGIGTWFVRLQAKRFGAGLVVSEMISAYGIHYRNRRTMREFLQIHPKEHPVSIQLFGADPAIMAGAAEVVAMAGADLIDINMGCPVHKVCKTGAGAALIANPDLAVSVASAVRESSDLPVTIKLRMGQRAGEEDGLRLAQRLAAEAGVAAITIHPRPADCRHTGSPDYAAAARLVDELPIPVMVTGGIVSGAKARLVFERTGCAAVLLARGAVGNPWHFRETLDPLAVAPDPEEVIDELWWLLDSAAEHWGEGKAVRHLRQIYPGFLKRLGGARSPAAQALMNAQDFAEVRVATNALLANSLALGASDSRPMTPPGDHVDGYLVA